MVESLPPPTSNQRGGGLSQKSLGFLIWDLKFEISQSVWLKPYLHVISRYMYVSNDVAVNSLFQFIRHCSVFSQDIVIFFHLDLPQYFRLTGAFVTQQFVRVYFHNSQFPSFTWNIWCYTLVLLQWFIQYFWTHVYFMLNL